VALTFGGVPLIATLYRSGPYLVIEIEHDETDDQRSAMVVREAAMSLQTGRSVVEVADAAARWIRGRNRMARNGWTTFGARLPGEFASTCRSMT